MAGPSVPQPDHRTPESAAPFHLHVVRWRGVAHSIALVNQWQLLAFAERTDVQLTAADAPLLKKWTPSTGLFNAEQERRLGLIPALASDAHVDAELRVFGPSDVTEPNDQRRLLVFAVGEFRGVPMGVLGASSLDVVNPRNRLSMVVPSSWVREHLFELGVRPERIEVVPHGAAPVFRPNNDARARLRQGLKLDRFTFLNIGVMTRNKGIVTLLNAFGRLLARGLPARLILKGNDTLYDSKAWLNGSISEMDPEVRELALQNLTYLGQAAGMDDMAALYNAADAYVSPYLAEGFNLPVLEAAATGLPIICTSGGPTDDFTTDEFRRGIDGRLTSADGRTFLQPDADHLLELMSAMVTDAEFQRQARVAGPAHVDRGYRWEHAADRLLAIART